MSLTSEERREMDAWIDKHFMPGRWGMPRRARLFGFLLLLYLVAALLLLYWLQSAPASAQTRVAPVQVSKTLTVVEWAVCEAPPIVSPGMIQDCRGLELYRFRLADGRVLGPYVAVLAPEGWDRPPDRWTWRKLE